MRDVVGEYKPVLNVSVLINANGVDQTKHQKRLPWIRPWNPLTALYGHIKTAEQQTIIRQ